MHVRGQGSPAQSAHQVGHAADADDLAEDETGDDRPRHRPAEGVAEHATAQVDSRVGQSEDRDHQEGTDRVQGALQIVEHAPPGQGPGGGEQSERHPREGGVDSRFQGGEPDQHTDGNIRPGRAHPEPSHGGGDQQSGHRAGQPPEADAFGVEDGDDADGQDVVHDGDAEQEQLRPGGGTAAQQRQDAHGEGDVRGHRNAPPASRFPASGHSRVGQRREHDAADGSQRGQRRGTAVTQLPHDQFPLDLQADDEEEHDHQPVVDPVPQIVDHPRLTAAEADLLLPELGVALRRRAVGPHQRARRGNDQDDPARALRVQERPQRGSDHSRHAFDRTNHAFCRPPVTPRSSSRLAMAMAMHTLASTLTEITPRRSRTTPDGGNSARAHRLKHLPSRRAAHGKGIH